MAEGLKHDGGKLEINLLIFKYLFGVIKVLMFGAKKYKPNSWQNVENGAVRYYAALGRHYFAMQKDDVSLDLNALDEESGLPHVWHMQCNAYFLEKFRQDINK
jgi:hypothetical protein